MLDTWAERHLLHPVLFFPGLIAGACKPRYSGGLKVQCLPVCPRLQSEFKDSLGGLLRPDFKTGGKRQCWGHSSVGQCFLAPGSVSSTTAINQYPKTHKPFLCFVCYYIYSAWDTSCFVVDAQQIPSTTTQATQKNAVCSWGLPSQLPCLYWLSSNSQYFPCFHFSSMILD